MTDLIEVQTRDLAGRPLNWAVAQAVKPKGFVLRDATGEMGCWVMGIAYDAEDPESWLKSGWAPSTDWNVGGPLIEKYRVLLTPPTDLVHRNFGNFDSRNGWYESGMWGSTIFGKDRKHRRTAFHHPDSPLIAAMRAIVQFELGDTVQVPKELI
jgi:hypothetical protein